MSQTKQLLHIRAEVKPQEERTAITPENAKQLIDSGLFTLHVERSTDRIFPDEEYAGVGCTLVETGSWPSADPAAFIVGLKELPEEDSPLTHRHVFFGHCFKQQTGWKELLHRFTSGKGTLLDLEFLVNEQGRRVAAFGRAAGLAGCAVGLMVWAQQQLHGFDVILPPIKSYPSVGVLAKEVAHSLAKVKELTGKSPKVMVMGAKGRCGSGALYFLKEAGVEGATEWDMEETARGGPFAEIADHHVFVNCIYLMGAIQPFVTRDQLGAIKDRPLSVVVDVSCDYTNPANPLPIYNEATTFLRPTVRVPLESGPLDVVSIDHLPSMIPRESSTDFSNDLLPSLFDLAAYASGQPAPVWDRAVALFNQKVAEAQPSA
jgi:saccharopine dehydrogenase (NAD+, L-lysine-forming)